MMLGLLRRIFHSSFFPLLTMACILKDRCCVVIPLGNVSDVSACIRQSKLHGPHVHQLSTSFTRWRLPAGDGKGSADGAESGSSH